MNVTDISANITADACLPTEFGLSVEKASRFFIPLIYGSICIIGVIGNSLGETPISSPGREIFQKLCKKRTEMRWFFKKFSAKTLHNNALKGAEMRWNFVRIALNFQRISYK